MLKRENVLFSVADHITPKIDMEGVAYTLESRDYKNAQCVVYNGSNITCPTNASNPKPGDACHTLTDDNRNYVICENHKKQKVYDWHRQDTRMTECGDVCVTAAAGWGGGGNNMPYVLEETMVTQGINGETAGTLDSNYYKGCGERQETEREVVMENQYDNLVVRRLTPMECSRLQDYPDGWMDIGEWKDSKGKVHKESDAPKYKAAGNSIALPFWQWLINRIKAELDAENVENPTMASLFDGISGFPLCSIRAGITPVWSSEIEEFPIAVAEKHFGENGDYKNFI